MEEQEAEDGEGIGDESVGEGSVVEGHQSLGIRGKKGEEIRI